jgi:hypothetical protein
MKCQWNTVLLALVLTVAIITCNAEYRVGVGRADITGPPVEITFVSQ